MAEKVMMKQKKNTSPKKEALEDSAVHAHRLQRRTLTFWQAFKISVGKTFGVLSVFTIFLIVGGMILGNIFSGLPVFHVQRWLSYEYKKGTLKPAYALQETFTDNSVAIVRLRGDVSQNCYGDYICPDIFHDLVGKLVEDNVRGVILIVNSGGGELGASEQLYQLVTYLKRYMPVWVYIEDMAASGAYYFIAPADKIVASKISEVGSIGVYLELLNYDGLLKKLGIERKIMVSKNSKYKRIDTWLFNNKQDEVDNMVSESLDYAWQVFVDRVTTNRPNVDKEAFNGGIWHAPKAYKLGLVDKIADSFEGLLVEFVENIEPGTDWIIYEYGVNTGFVPSIFSMKVVDNMSLWNLVRGLQKPSVEYKIIMR